MRFVRTEDLQAGLRLAKPIYNKNGVLLYDRNSLLTTAAIESIHNFGLIGIYILEPAEPIPPFSREDIEFEQAQTIYIFRLKDSYEQIYKQKPLAKFHSLIEDILHRYGDLDHRVNFNQNIRSADDFMYKHAISTALITAMISNHVKLSDEDRHVLIASALLFDFGYRFVPHNIMEKGIDLTQMDIDTIQVSLEKGIRYFEIYHDAFPYMKKAISVVDYYITSRNPAHSKHKADEDIVLLSDILKVAETFDLHTGMNIGYEPESEIVAMKSLEEHPELYNKKIVFLLGQCIHIVPAGASVDLSTKDKGIVLVENPDDFMKPLILRLSDNHVYDLSLPHVSKRIQIIDLMKTMDNRIEIDEDTLKLFVADRRISEMTKRIKEKQKKLKQ